MKSEYRLYKHAWVYAGCPDQESRLTSDEATALLRQGGWMVRNVYDFDIPSESRFWFVIKDSFEEMDTFPKKIQHYISKANEAFEIRPISKERMIAEGYEVYCEAFDHYTIQEWKQSKDEFIRSLDNPAYEFWGCIFRETGKLEAWLICHPMGHMVSKVSSKANPAYLPKYYPMYGLNHRIHEYYLKEKKVQYILSGSRTATDHSNIQTFLMEKFGYRKAYCRLKIYYRWWLGLMVRCLYPFRRIIKNVPVRALLNMHEMQS